MCTKLIRNTAGLILGALLLLGRPCAAEMRYWHERDGKEFSGAYEKQMFGNYYFRGMDGRLFKVAATNLIDSDIEYINARAAPPKLKVKFSVKQQVISDYPTEYIEALEIADIVDVETEVTGSVEIRKISKAPYSGTLQAEFYLIAAELATDDFRLFAKKRFPVSFPDPDKQTVETSLVKRLRSWETGENWRGAKYTGYIVIVSEADGTVVSFDTNLSWMKQDKIEALRKLACPSFLDKECKKRPVPRPTAQREITPNAY